MLLSWALVRLHTVQARAFALPRCKTRHAIALC